MPLFAHHVAAVSPLQPLHELTQAAAAAALEMSAAALLGHLAARAMRARGIHHGWAAAVAALALLARTELGHLWPVAVVGSLWTLKRVRRLHRQDLIAGADLAALAASRRSPITLLRVGCDRALERLLARATHASPRAPLGRDEHGRPVPLPIGDRHAGGRHTLVVGATGSGKTVTQTRIAVAAIQRGLGAVVLDPKGDAGLAAALARAVRETCTEFHAWTPSGESVYNPLARGTDTEIADKALAGEQFSEPHYLRQAQRYVAHAVRALRASGSAVSLAALVRCLDVAELELLLRGLPEDVAGSSHAYLDSLTRRQRADLAGVRDRLAILAESDVGRWVEPLGGAREIDLLDCLRRREVVYFSLESDRRPLLSKMLAAAIVQDLLTVVASSHARPLDALVMIDEFSALAAEHVVRLFGRARSAGISLLLGTQEIADLRLPGSERLLEQVMGNLAVLIAHRQVVPSSAELVSRLAGSSGAWRISHHSDGRTTRTRTREALLQPDTVMRLRTGVAAVLELDDRAAAGARIVRVLPPETSAAAHAPARAATAGWSR